MKALSDNKQTTINLITSLAAFVINAGISFVLTPYILPVRQLRVPPGQ